MVFRAQQRAISFFLVSSLAPLDHLADDLPRPVFLSIRRSVGQRVRYDPHVGSEFNQRIPRWTSAKLLTTVTPPSPQGQTPGTSSSLNCLSPYGQFPFPFPRVAVKPAPTTAGGLNTPF